MKRIVLLLVGLVLFGGVAHAQYDERERLANDPRSAGAGAYHAKRSLLSLGSNDRSSWTVPAQQRDGSWTQRYVSSNDNITIRVPQRRVSRTAQQKVNRKAQRDAEHSAWLEQRNAQLEAAQEAQRERDRIRRAKEAAENAADRQMGYARHMAATAGYYRSQQMRDQAMAIEARRLDERYTARRVATPPPANTPKVNTMSDDELAGLLDPQPVGRIIFVEPSKKIEGSFSEGGTSRLDVTDNYLLDEDVLTKWQWASEEKNILSFSHKRRESLPQEPILLLANDELEIDSVSLFVLPNYGLVMPVGDSLMVLKDRSLNCVAWQDGREYYQVVPCGDRLIGQSETGIYDLAQRTSEPLVAFDTSDYMLFAKDNQSVLALVWYDDISSVIELNVATKSYEELIRIDQAIWKVESNGEKTFILIGEDIYLLSDEGEPHLFYRSETTINDLVFSPWGLLLATDTEVVRIISPTQTETFYPYGAYRVWVDGKEVYLLDSECNLLYMEDGAAYLQQ